MLSRTGGRAPPGEDRRLLKPPRSPVRSWGRTEGFGHHFSVHAEALEAFRTSFNLLVASARNDHFIEHDVFQWTIPRVARHGGNRMDDFFTFDHLAENAVSAVEPRRRLLSDEKLAPVG